MSRLRPSVLPLLGGFAAAVLIALLPWWRNRGYLRDIYDYGLVLAANGRMDLGEQPYVDFTTPIQAGFLKLNWFFERIGGGDYGSLTWGGAVLIMVMVAALSFLLGKRWPWWAAVPVAASVTVMTASQHTILWHNSLGVFALALVAWASACAPVWRGVSWRWHSALAAGLFLGGINKLNFHLIGVAVALAWALRAGLVKSSGWRRVGMSWAGIVFFGVVLPLAAEIGWTGARLSEWYRNVVSLAVGSRSELLREIWSVDFLLKPIHDYYGKLMIGQVGLVGVIFTVVTFWGGWRRSEGMTGRVWGVDRVLAVAAALLAGFAGAALLMTNYDIAYLGVGAWLVVALSVWLGFSLPVQTRLFRYGLWLPAIICGAASWWSAWQGQRSQFGFSVAPREDYQAAETLGPKFANLHGLRLPPEVMFSLREFVRVMPVEQPDGAYPLFYGKGMEFFHRYYPGIRWRGMPLWCHFGTSYGPREMERLNDLLANDDALSAVFVTQAYDHWPQPLRDTLQKSFARDLVGPVLVRWQRRDAGLVNLLDSVSALERIGGNVDPRVFHLDHYPLKPVLASDHRLLLATSQTVGQLVLRVPLYRLRGVFVIDRLKAPADTVIEADVKLIVHGSSPEDVRWSERVALPAGQQSVAVPFEATLDGKPPQIWINRIDAMRGVVAGFRDFEIMQAFDSAEGPPILRDQLLPESAVDPVLANSFFGPLAWRPDALVVRGGAAHQAGLRLAPGADVWLRPGAVAGEVRGQVTAGDPGASALVRVVWYKHGQMKILDRCRVTGPDPVEFHGRSVESGGWIGLLVSPEESTTAVDVRVTHTTFAR